MIPPGFFLSPAAVFQQKDAVDGKEKYMENYGNIQGEIVLYCAFYYTYGERIKIQ